MQSVKPVKSVDGASIPQAQNRAVGSTLARDKDVPLFFFGMLCMVAGLSLYFIGILFSVFRLMLNLNEPFQTWNQAIVWYSGVPSTLGVVLAAADLAFLFPRKRKRSRSQTLEPVADRHVVVALTAYNDEESIGPAVADFSNHPMVKRVIVVDNNSRDKTADFARAAGAVVVREMKPGYGNCVYRWQLCVSLLSGGIGRTGRRADCRLRG
jgi:hypothetical protein